MDATSDDRSAELARIAHALRRTGFLAHPGAAEEWYERGGARGVIEAALDDDGPAIPDLDIGPDWEDSQRALGWILERFRSRDASLTDRMSWFWHDHFATSMNKVGSAAAMWNQHRLLRRHALGNFRALVHDITVDPAMLRYLDGEWSHGDEPNENYSRELMELFTLGVGQYSEADVRAGAKALSGWMVDDDALESWHEPEIGFAGTVTFLGNRGRLDAHDVVDTVCDHPACAPFVAAKVHRALTGTDPTPARLEAIADTFRASGLEIRPLIAAILTDDSFLEIRLNRYREPVEWLSAALVATQPEVDIDPWMFDQFGQSPWYPPNVGGWPSGERWAAADQMIRRSQLATWWAPGEVEFDFDDPVGHALRRCSLYEVRPETRAALERVAARTASNEWEQPSLVMGLALMSPDFALT